MMFDEALREFEQIYRDKWKGDTRVDTSDAQVLRVYSPATLRANPGNHPKILHHGQKTDHVIVLIHGITDSPYYVEEIGRRFHEQGFNVVLPLLPAHGLLSPGPAFRTLDFEDWIADINRAVTSASGLGENVSLGGFSTGGALSVEKVIRSPNQIDGGLFLFSAALDIGSKNQFLLQLESGRMISRLKDDKIWLGKSLEERFDALKRDQDAGLSDAAYGIDDVNPYKYSVFFYEGASELAKLIEVINDHYAKSGTKYGDIKLPVFVAHSKSDEAALFAGAELFYKNHPNDKKANYWIEKLPHAGLVLKSAIVDDTNHFLYTPPNSKFEQMIDEMLKFTRQYVTIGE